MGNEEEQVGMRNDLFMHASAKYGLRGPMNAARVLKALVKLP